MYDIYDNYCIEVVNLLVYQKTFPPGPALTSALTKRKLTYIVTDPFLSDHLFLVFLQELSELDRIRKTRPSVFVQTEYALILTGCNLTVSK